MILFLLIVTICSLSLTHSYGYDSSAPLSCSRARAARARAPPCDLQRHGWCAVAGAAYPWRAVRSFIRENQGLMRRMYGDERHIAVLRAELTGNDVQEQAMFSLTHSYGYDSSAPLSCSRARAARARAPPCDLQRHGWCAVAGAAYPWRAVRSFIRENQGLMRRMYGDERHIAVLRAELTGNDVQDQVMFRYTDPDKPKPKPDHRFAKDTETPRLLNHDDAILNTKFIYSEEPNLRTNELYTLPHFRQQTSTTEMTSFIENNTILEPVAVPGNNTADTNSVYMNFTITFAREGGNLTTVEESTEVENTTEAEGTTEEMGTTTETVTTVEEGVGDKVVSSTPGGSGQLFQDSEQEEKVTYKRRGVNACPVKEEVVAPFWANNTRGEVLALLNFYPFEQYVHWEKCTFEHRQMYCREGCRCEQQYRLHRLLAYDPNNECRGIFSDWFKFPSCCVCKCYDMPVEFRVTSRSPRQREAPPHAPEWYRRKIGVKDREG